MHNKKGQGLSTNAIILIVLGVFVLAILILGFTLGWGKIAPWINKPNVKDMVSACDVACLTDAKYDFCSINRTVKDGVNDNFENTCFNLWNETEYKGRNYGFNECPSIDCKVAAV